MRWIVDYISTNLFYMEEDFQDRSQKKISLFAPERKGGYHGNGRISDPCSIAAVRSWHMHDQPHLHIVQISFKSLTDLTSFKIVQAVSKIHHM